MSVNALDRKVGLFRFANDVIVVYPPVYPIVRRRSFSILCFFLSFAICFSFDVMDNPNAFLSLGVYNSIFLPRVSLSA